MGFFFLPNFRVCPPIDFSAHCAFKGFPVLPSRLFRISYPINCNVFYLYRLFPEQAFQLPSLFKAASMEAVLLLYASSPFTKFRSLSFPRLSFRRFYFADTFFWCEHSQKQRQFFNLEDPFPLLSFLSTNIGRPSKKVFRPMFSHPF